MSRGPLALDPLDNTNIWNKNKTYSSHIIIPNAKYTVKQLAAKQTVAVVLKFPAHGTN
jgi:hypothetical protein